MQAGRVDLARDSFGQPIGHGLEMVSKIAFFSLVQLHQGFFVLRALPYPPSKGLSWNTQLTRRGGLIAPVRIQGC